jgi:REP element-mobilizing transposase RayT
MINGMEDHVHALVRMKSTVSVAVLAKQMKGDSSHFINHVIVPEASFRWQSTYGAFSVSPDGVAAVERYIRNQKEHHAGGTITAEWERSWVERDPNA